MTSITFSVFFISFYLLCLDSLCVIGGYKAATVEQLGSYPRINKNQRSRPYSSNFNSKVKSSPFVEPEIDTNEEVTQRGTGFIDRSSRIGFIRKVYSIFTFQTFITAAITSTILLNPYLGKLFLDNKENIVIFSLIGQVVSSFSLILSEKIRFTFPINMIILTMYSVFQSLIVGLIASTMETRTVCAGTIHTLITFVAMTLFAFQSNPKYDLTTFGNTLLTGMTALVVGVLSAAFFGVSLSSALTNGVLACGFAAYIAYDTQTIVGGKHKKRSLNTKEYILASLGLYQDVIGFFIKMLQILDAMDDRKKNRRK